MRGGGRGQLPRAGPAEVVQVEKQFPNQGEPMLCDNDPTREVQREQNGQLATPSVLISIFQGIQKVSTRNHCRAPSLRMV